MNGDAALRCWIKWCNINEQHLERFMCKYLKISLIWFYKDIQLNDISDP